MQVVQDNSATPWEIDITVDAYRRINRDCKIDLGMARFPGPSGLPLSVQLYESPLLLLDVLWVMCQPRAGTKGINKDDFDNRFFGPALEAAKTAFFHEWRDFFLKSGRPADAEMVTNTTVFLPKQATDQLQEQRATLGASSTTSLSNTPESPESKTSAA